jgi:hypothetical protein
MPDITLESVRDRVRLDLRDTDETHQRWDDETLDRHIDRALRELSLAAPRQATALLETEAGSRDLDISDLADRVTVEAVEYPAGRYPPSYVPSTVWGDVLTLQVPRAPSGGESVVVRYGALHTLDTQGTTLPERLVDLVATGAAAYAAIEWASHATNRINVGGDDVWRHYHTWGQERLAAFARNLAKHGRERRLRTRRLIVGAPVPAPAEG